VKASWERSGHAEKGGENPVGVRILRSRHEESANQPIKLPSNYEQALFQSLLEIRSLRLRSGAGSSLPKERLLEMTFQTDEIPEPRHYAGVFELARTAQPRPICLHQRLFYQVLTQKPGLQFVGSQHITHNQIVGAIIAKLIGALG
jgi:hypothetical protein